MGSWESVWETLREWARKDRERSGERTCVFVQTLTSNVLIGGNGKDEQAPWLCVINKETEVEDGVIVESLMSVVINDNPVE